MEETFVGQVTQKAILKYKGSFVLVKEDAEGKWILPGGRLNIGETAEEGLLREIKEELGVESVLEGIVSTSVYHGTGEGRKGPKIFIFYTAAVSPDQTIAINNEIIDVAYVSKKEELEKYSMPDNQKKALERFLS